MASKFLTITEDFSAELEAIRTMVLELNNPSAATRVRTSSARAAILLLAAVYEEYVRQMAGEHALCVADSPRSKRLRRKAWKITFDELARVDPFVGSNEVAASVRTESMEKIESLFTFVSGNLHSELLPSTIRNERNMRPAQLNQIFKLSRIDDISREICDRQCLIEYLSADNPDIAYGLFFGATQKLL